MRKICFPNIQKFVSNWLGAILGVVLLLTAWIHRLQIDRPDYTKSHLIGVEVVLVILVFLVSFLYHPGNAVVLGIKKRWPEAVTMMISALVGIGLLIAAAYIDAPTIIFMT